MHTAVFQGHLYIIIARCYVMQQQQQLLLNADFLQL
jgi:hypothetical protein